MANTKKGDGKRDCNSQSNSQLSRNDGQPNRFFPHNDGKDKNNSSDEEGESLRELRSIKKSIRELKEDVSSLTSDVRQILALLTRNQHSVGDGLGNKRTRGNFTLENFTSFIESNITPRLHDIALRVAPFLLEIRCHHLNLI
jgi:hypothetical protein